MVTGYLIRSPLRPLMSSFVAVSTGNKRAETHQQVSDTADASLQLNTHFNKR